MKDENYNTFKKELSELHRKGFELQVANTMSNYDESNNETFTAITVIMSKSGNHLETL